MPITLLLVIVYFGLGIALIRQIYLAVKDKQKDKSRLLLIGFLILVLTLTFIKPFGLINFDELEGKDILIAQREGAANCMTTLKLKDNYTFRERIVCFSVTEIKGTYHFQNDTIYFDNNEISRDEKDFYRFAVIRPSKYYSNKKYFDLTRYKNLTDTVGHNLTITKNELNKFKNKKPNR